ACSPHGAQRNAGLTFPDYALRAPSGLRPLRPRPKRRPEQRPAGPYCRGMDVHVRDRTDARTVTRSGRGGEKPARTRVFAYGVPAVFDLLWASGFVVPRAFAPYAEPLTFVAVRNAGAAVVLVLAALVAGPAVAAHARRSNRPPVGRRLAAGLLPDGR